MRDKTSQRDSTGALQAPNPCLPPRPLANGLPVIHCPRAGGGEGGGCWGAGGSSGPGKASLTGPCMPAALRSGLGPPAASALLCPEPRLGQLWSSARDRRCGPQEAAVAACVAAKHQSTAKVSATRLQVIQLVCAHCESAGSVVEWARTV